MTDLEIIEILKGIKPDSDEQKTKIKKAIGFFKPIKFEIVREYLNLHTNEEINNKVVNDVYISYIKWCKKNNIDPVCKNEFSIAVKEKCGLVSKVKTINGKSYRVYQ